MDGDNNHLRNSAPFFLLRSWIWFANIIYLCKGTYAGGKGGNLQPKAGKYQNCKTAIIATISRLHKCTICTMRLDAHLVHWADCGVRSITFWCHFFIPSVCKDSGCLIKRRWSDFTFILAQFACTLHLLCTCFAHFHTLHNFILHTLSHLVHTLHILRTLSYFAHFHTLHTVILSIYFAHTCTTCLHSVHTSALGSCKVRQNTLVSTIRLTVSVEHFGAVHNAPAVN